MPSWTQGEGQGSGGHQEPMCGTVWAVSPGQPVFFLMNFWGAEGWTVTRNSGLPLGLSFVANQWAIPQAPSSVYPSLSSPVK